MEGKAAPAGSERCVFCRGYLDGACNGSIAGACDRYDRVAHPRWAKARRWAAYRA